MSLRTMLSSSVTKMLMAMRLSCKCESSGTSLSLTQMG